MSKLRIAFLGPFGTFTEQALRQVAPENAELIPLTSPPLAMKAVREGKADWAVVPIENSIEGGVNATLDALADYPQLVIRAEMLVPITFHLAVRPGTRAEDIRKIGTHPHAWAQCRNWAEETFPGVVHVPATSTAAAAETLGASEGAFDAVLCSATSVERYGLESLFTDVADNPGAITRFVCVRRPIEGSLTAPTGHDKTTIQVALPVNQAGSLMRLLEQFSVHDVDLSRIESRPSGDGLGAYTFSIDMVGHITQEHIQAALRGLYRVSPDVRFMGSYPSSTVNSADVPQDDEDYRRARTWVRELIAGVSQD